MRRRFTTCSSSKIPGRNHFGPTGETQIIIFSISPMVFAGNAQKNMRDHRTDDSRSCGNTTDVRESSVPKNQALGTIMDARLYGKCKCNHLTAFFLTMRSFRSSRAASDNRSNLPGSIASCWSVKIAVEVAERFSLMYHRHWTHTTDRDGGLLFLFGLLGSGVRVPLPLPIKSAISEITETINIRRTMVRTTFSVTNLHWQKFCRFRSDALRWRGWCCI